MCAGVKVRVCYWGGGGGMLMCAIVRVMACYRMRGDGGKC